MAASTRMHVRSSTLSSNPLDATRSARSSQATTLNDSDAVHAQLGGGGGGSGNDKTLTPPPQTTAVFTSPHNNDDTTMDSSSSSSESGLEMGELNEFSRALSRLRDARLDRQRYVMSEGKDAEVSKLAFSAKVERALARRMVGQDAVFSHPDAKNGGAIDVEKRAMKIAAD